MKRKSWTKEQLKDAVRSSFSYRKVLNKLGLREAGGNYAQIKKYISEYGFSVGHFKGKGWNAGLKGGYNPRESLNKILVNGSDFQSFKLKRRLFKEKIKPEHCEECGWDKRSVDGRIPLELHHINGDRKDNRLENLIVLCPNCHSLKLNHRGRNIKK
ncbi:MAG: HNH endonuclease signature motif containing protein [Patescibacteria group bacterium]|nr:HNH endonuclease signature motif containing protein [Patescibacteria group bacterium]